MLAALGDLPKLMTVACESAAVIESNSAAAVEEIGALSGLMWNILRKGAIDVS